MSPPDPRRCETITGFPLGTAPKGLPAFKIAAQRPKRVP